MKKKIISICCFIFSMGFMTSVFAIGLDLKNHSDQTVIVGYKSVTPKTTESGILSANPYMGVALGVPPMTDTDTEYYLPSYQVTQITVGKKLLSDCSTLLFFKTYDNITITIDSDGNCSASTS
jgi:hypothetical protein